MTVINFQTNDQFAVICQETQIFTKTESLILIQKVRERFDMTYSFDLVLFVHSINANKHLRKVNVGTY